MPSLFIKQDIVLSDGSNPLRSDPAMCVKRRKDQFAIKTLCCFYLIKFSFLIHYRYHPFVELGSSFRALLQGLQKYKVFMGVAFKKSYCKQVNSRVTG